eukprot:2091072-Prymnesium_polylepis.2
MPLRYAAIECCVRRTPDGSGVRRATAQDNHPSIGSTHTRSYALSGAVARPPSAHLVDGADAEGAAEASERLAEAELPEADDGPRQAEGRLREERDRDREREDELRALPRLVRRVGRPRDEVAHERLADDELHAQAGDDDGEPEQDGRVPQEVGVGQVRGGRRLGRHVPRVVRLECLRGDRLDQPLRRRLWPYQNGDRLCSDDDRQREERRHGPVERRERRLGHVHEVAADIAEVRVVQRVVQVKVGRVDAPRGGAHVQTGRHGCMQRRKPTRPIAA